MLFHQIASLIFSIIKIIILFNVAPKAKCYEEIFTEKSQNITLANKIIEELLKNYEMLKHIYKSQEFFHSSSSFEVNKTFKNLQAEETTRHRIRSLKKILSYKQTTLHPGTAIIYGSALSHEEILSSVEKTNDKHTKIVKNKNLNRVKFENILENNNKHGSVMYESKESETNDDIEEISLEIPSTSDVSGKPNKNVIKSKKPLKKHKPKKHNDLGEKTRFDVLQQAKRKKQKNDKHRKVRAKTESEPNTRRIKKVVYSELFSPYNIWYEVINKPIKLNIDTDPFLEKRQDYLEDITKNLKVFILNSNIKESLKEQSEKSRKNKIDYIIRSTYGEVCLKTPIKKCKNAVKAVNKQVCKSGFKCKSEFKSDFLTFGDKECEKEFSFKKPKDNEKGHQESNEDQIPPLLRKQDDTDLHEYVGNEDYFKVTKDHYDIIVGKSVLRDKYERECQKQSRAKCLRACKHAVEKTCSKHTCEDRKNKALQKACKNECKTMFIIPKDSDESNSSDSESESATDDE